MNWTNQHLCYVIQSVSTGRFYIGYTTDFTRRIRQHNGEIKGGAKKTRNFRPWKPVLIISGFYDNSTALRFEYRLQRPRNKKPYSSCEAIISQINYLIDNGDGSVAKNNKLPWPKLTVESVK